MITHTCPVTYMSKHDGHGHAVEYMFEADDGTLWAENDEYGTQVNFCPFCGYKARTQLVLVPSRVPPEHEGPMG